MISCRAFCLGNILGPLTFTNPPEYLTAKITIIAVLGFAIILIFVLVYSYHRQNIHRLALAGTEGLDMAGENAFLDLTDRSNKSFLVSFPPLVKVQGGSMLTWSLLVHPVVKRTIALYKNQVVQDPPFHSWYIRCCGVSLAAGYRIKELYSH